MKKVPVFVALLLLMVIAPAVVHAGAEDIAKEVFANVYGHEKNRATAEVAGTLAYRAANAVFAPLRIFFNVPPSRYPAQYRGGYGYPRHHGGYRGYVPRRCYIVDQGRSHSGRHIMYTQYCE